MEYSDFDVVFSVQDFISEILDSYKFDNIKDAIYDQLVLDYHRTIVIFNKTRFKTVTEFLDHISYTKTTPFIFEYKKLILKRYKTLYLNLYTIISALCTQASFFHSYKLLFDIYTDPIKDLHIVHGPDAPTIIINDDGKKIDFQIRKTHVFMNINENLVLKRIQISMRFNIYYGVHDFNYDKYGVIEWGNRN